MNLENNEISTGIKHGYNRYYALLLNPKFHENATYSCVCICVGVYIVSMDTFTYIYTYVRLLLNSLHHK